MKEYGGYTIERIEDELTWEQIEIMSEAINERYRRINEQIEEGASRGAGRAEERHWDVEDLLDNPIPGLGFMVEKKVVN